jgi:hypothetical protein
MYLVKIRLFVPSTCSHVLQATSQTLATLLVATLALGLRPRQRVARLRVKRKTWESFHMLPGVQRVWGNEPSHSQVNPMLGVGVPNGLPNLQSTIVEAKTHRLKEFFISLKNYWNVDVWNGPACPFGHLKHKLWPKERSGVKLAIWLPTTKSRELTKFGRVQEACDIPLEISQ